MMTWPSSYTYDLVNLVIIKFYIYDDVYKPSGNPLLSLSLSLLFFDTIIKREMCGKIIVRANRRDV